MNKISSPQTVDISRPTREELDAMIAKRTAFPKVQAQELADELSVSPSALSKFENGRAALPQGMGVRSYETALERCKARKRQGAAA